MKTRGFIALAVAASAVACSGSTSASKDNVADDVTSEALTNVSTVGTLTNGQSLTFNYTSSPRLRAVKFTAKAKDVATVDVKSSTGDALTWIIDSSDKVLAFNDDANGNTLNSHVAVTLPASGTYRIIVRDYDYLSARFTASLGLKSAAPDFTTCARDADCVKVAKGCCAYLGNVAVNVSSPDAYKASLGCATPQICPMIMVRPDYSAALCNTNTHKCELVLPGDIACGGRTLNPHSCPSGYQCTGAALLVDGTGKCVQKCGGIAGLACNAGTTCVDDPTDSCDPTKGGADCIGICQ